MTTSTPQGQHAAHTLLRGAILPSPSIGIVIGIPVINPLPCYSAVTVDHTVASPSSIRIGHRPIMVSAPTGLVIRRTAVMSVLI